MIAAGDVFWFPDELNQPDGRGHNYVVLSDPALYPDQVVVVNFGTGEDYKDDACVIEVPPDRNLPYLTHTSCVEYERACHFTVAQLEYLLKEKIIRQQQRLPPDLFEKVRHGAAVTDRLPMKYEMMLEDQSLRNP